jgi:hypothetical protein
VRLKGTNLHFKHYNNLSFEFEQNKLKTQVHTDSSNSFSISFAMPEESIYKQEWYIALKFS